MADEWQTFLPPEDPSRVPLEELTERLVRLPLQAAEALVATAGPVPEAPDDLDVTTAVLAWMFALADRPRVQQAHVTLSQLAVSQAGQVARRRQETTIMPAHLLEGLRRVMAPLTGSEDAHDPTGRTDNL
jgi:hypothetical protein